ncbi:N-acetylmuramoyl-L-alanine amidase [Deinococcus multiflagellatus]|uniref:N-acetylmuramoyl-L-alanine amidase n=1 Tax=Deinococcus multiflagellatus TaxID=1656887 RepID=A0ABW1ZMN3_9DEIO|nr:N-acetylmuramoyl-L-alanine amidase [Deinococcus multiflagellatus]MBZ9716123.1 N-acetylmuramoyl-L-alanine amidase [Deinococcus multiflagellatus]
MKRTAILFSSGLLFALCGTGLAQTAVPATPLNLTGIQSLTFGPPRFSTQGSTTRVVFDLPTGVRYTLTPTFSGLRLDVQNARIQPAVLTNPGSSVNEVRAGAGQITLFTPFPLSFTAGWQASEATLATGGRVLILELGPAVTGGAAPTLQGQVLSSAPATPGAQAVLSGAGTLPPGDTVAPTKVLPPAPALPAPALSGPMPLQGRVPGEATAAAVPAPRIGKNPGQTRVVLDLPPGSSYRLVPGAAGLNVELGGVTLAAQSARAVSPELREWRFAPGTMGGVVSLLTPSPVTARSGWRAQLLPPASGTAWRLVLDLSPALADLSPLTPAERTVAAVPPVLATRGTAILALSANFVRPRVVVDAGHGGRDPGAVGTIVEKDVTLAVALRVRDLLTAAGVDVVLTRDSDRELHPVKNTDLEMRAAMGTPGTQLFVSIHVNAMAASTALRGYGIETWWNPNHPQSSALAGLLQQHLTEVTGAFNRGLKNSQSLSVLRNSRVPAALVEIGYTSHPVDGLNLRDPNYLDRVALGIALGIRESLVSGVTAQAAPAPTTAKRP